ncbi:MAG: NAD(+)/NADH kinase [Bacillota bacterium]|nr:NAD(+)/NADH kinase [Bacillota bacterium]
MPKIGIIPNTSKDECGVIMREFFEGIDGRAQLFVPAQDKIKEEDFFTVLEREDFFKTVDVIVVLGGDGSILRAAPEAAKEGKPILGINLGRLGYLASAEKASAKIAAKKLLDGDYKIREHMMLETHYVNHEGKPHTILALNDVVAARSESGRIIEIVVYVGDEYVDTYMADGIVIATPTGSTAYSLSAGGPVAYPTMDMFVVTPICSHDLHSRSIVIPYDKKITIKLGHKYDYKALMTVDGQIVHPMEKDDCFTVSMAPVRTKLIKMDDFGFYDLLRSKLKGTV